MCSGHLRRFRLGVQSNINGVVSTLRRSLPEAGQLNVVPGLCP